MANEIALFRNLGLATPTAISYSAPMNAFVGSGFTSQGGNTYFNAARFADGILIKEDVGEGWLHTFLNGIHIYDLSTKKLLCERYFNCHYYSKETVKSDVKHMLEDLVLSSARKEGHILNDGEVRTRINSIIDRSFATNQMEVMNRQMRALGF